MKRKFLRIASSLLCVSMLFGCTLNENLSWDTPIDQVFVEQTPDPVKDSDTDPVAQLPDTNDTTDNQNPEVDYGTNDGTNTTAVSDLNEFDVVAKNNTVYPDHFFSWHETHEDFPSMDVHVSGIDGNGNTIWERVFPDINIGQYDMYTDLFFMNDDYLIVVDGTLYAINCYTGLTDWSVENVGYSCSYAFKDNSVYITGYEGPALVVIDANGNVVHRYDQFTNANDLGDYYWACDLFFEDEKLYKKYDSSNFCLLVNPRTGEAIPEEFSEGSEEKFEELLREWEFGHYQGRTDLECTYAKDITGECTLEIDEGYYVSFHFQDKDIDLNADYVKGYFRPRDLYDGVRDDFYGEWVLEGEVDPWNSFAMQMTEPDTLEMIWFVSDGANNEFYKFEFGDAEILQYYKDKLELNNQNK